MFVLAMPDGRMAGRRSSYGSYYTAAKLVLTKRGDTAKTFKTRKEIVEYRRALLRGLRHNRDVRCWQYGFCQKYIDGIKRQTSDANKLKIKELEFTLK